MGSRQIVLVLTVGFSVLNTGIFWREAKTKRLFLQCSVLSYHGSQSLWSISQWQSMPMLSVPTEVKYMFFLAVTAQFSGIPSVRAVQVHSLLFRKTGQRPAGMLASYPWTKYL
jgi:hypothetical protein